MEKTPERGQRKTVLAAFIILGAVLALCPCASALDPSLDVSQYAHTSWRVRDGFVKGRIWAIAQTPDGYLWLGTDFGLYRFDGVRAVPWQPPPGQQLPSNLIFGLHVARDGNLWIGTSTGLASWKNGTLTLYPALAGYYVREIVEDREGTIWVGSLGTPTGELCAIRNGSTQCYGQDGSFGIGVLGLYEDSKDNLWVGTKGGLWRWKPGPPHFYSVPDTPNGISAILEDKDGSLLIAIDAELCRFIDGKIELNPLRGAPRRFKMRKLLRDHDAGLWLGTEDQGLFHAHQGRIESFGRSEGLSGDDVLVLFQDREDNVWVGGSSGLDRFREFAAATFTAKQGLSNNVVGSILANKDGSVLLASFSGLDRWRDGKIATYNGRDGKLDGLPPNSMLQDDRGRIWVSTNRGFGYLENNRFVAMSGVPDGPVHGIVEDSGGDLWIGNQNHGLIHLSGSKVLEEIAWSSLSQAGVGLALAVDRLRGGLWLGFSSGGVVNFSGGRIRASYKAADGLGGGRVNNILIDQEGTVWAATDGGLSRFKNGHFATLAGRNGLPCDKVHWVIEDDDRAFWLYMACGLIRITKSDMDRWASAADKNEDFKQAIPITIFDDSDGVRSLAITTIYTPLVAKSSDGKIWFSAIEQGAAVIDPRHLPFNALPPLVHVEQITADRKTYDAVSQLRLPPMIRDMEIDYTALSLVAPEKVHFRYKLDGRDRDWMDVGNRRQAFYSDLPPGNYRFRVTASNNSGVWNEAGTSLDFSIAPAYFQTIWFRLMGVAAFLLLLWGLYHLRVHQLAREFNMGLEARVSERTRIARDLHDTLLQSFQGLLLRFQTVSQILPEGNAKQTLDSAIDQAAQAITEGRNAVRDLRPPSAETSDLAEAIRTLGEEISSVETNRGPIVFRVDVEGKPRNVHPILRDEIYRIAGEALRNAFNHAQASQIEVEIRYDDRHFRLRVRDDGKGIDPKVLGGNGRAGHFGLHGMRERAKLMGGNLAVWSELDSGTEVELSVPASSAYSSSSGGRTTGIFRKLAGKGTQGKS
jgi:signal transduction histidine kinase/ligand-binding sensor domain-containing protein